MKYWKKPLACVLLVLMLSAMVIPASAYLMEPDRLCSFEISFRHEDTPVSGAAFQVWRVGELSTDGALSLSGHYAAYPVRVSSRMSNVEFQTAANTLAGYVHKDAVTPDFEGQTNSDGILRFEDLPRGLYLVTSTPYNLSDRKILHTAPQFVILPYRPISSEPWQYDVVMNTKSSLEEIPKEDEVVRVLKIWNDDGAEDCRPAHIAVHLLCDSAIYETVKLSKENNWRYEWIGLDPDCTWTVVEDIDRDYTVTVEKTGITYVITNTINTPPPPPPDTPVPPPTPTPPPAPGGVIPDTGLNWWPAIIMGVLGVALIIAGMLRRKEDRHEA